MEKCHWVYYVPHLEPPKKNSKSKNSFHVKMSAIEETFMLAQSAQSKKLQEKMVQVEDSNRNTSKVSRQVKTLRPLSRLINFLKMEVKLTWKPRSRLRNTWLREIKLKSTRNEVQLPLRRLSLSTQEPNQRLSQRQEWSKKSPTRRKKTQMRMRRTKCWMMRKSATTRRQLKSVCLLS